jgi:hypothetical protein
MILLVLVRMRIRMLMLAAPLSSGVFLCLVHIN